MTKEYGPTLRISQEMEELIDKLMYVSTGKLCYKDTGKEAGTCHNQGYRTVTLHGKKFLTHRIIFAMHYGYLPPQTDHIDGDRSNNLISNLRPATNSINSRNSKQPKNSTGVMGVSFHKASNKWMARIYTDAGAKYLGVYSDYTEAVRVRKEAETLNNYHANHGRAV